ncbi:MAG TPA: hypothetical protein VK497_02360 [Candidatus Saccharimonadales bacterium]|nr:hypothetical protein [Candidatus Saccharimonadales bacterium]
MKKSILMRAITSLCLVIGLCVGLIPAGTASAADRNDFTGVRFWNPHLCILVHNGVWESWPIATAAAYFDSSGVVDIVVRKESQGGCGNYWPFQVLHVRQANLGNNTCGTHGGTGTPYPSTDHPWNPYYEYVYGYPSGVGGHATPSMTLNSGWSACYNSNIRLANTASQSIGNALGLSRLYEAKSTPTVMLDSDYNNARTPWATAYDRNNLYALYYRL